MAKSKQLKIPIRCAATGRAAESRPLKGGAAALPPGWKRLGSEFYSAEGWSSLYALRSVGLPVASVAEGYLGDGDGWPTNEAAAASWKSFRESLRASFRDATRCANWALVELAKADTEPMTPCEKGVKLPKMPAPADLYAGARAAAPELDSQSAGSLLQKVRGRYSDCRFDLRVRSAVTLPTYRFPTPIPVPAKDSELALLPGGELVAYLRVAGRQFTVRLAAGREWDRQRGPLRAVVRGELLRGEAVLRERAVPTAGRNGGHARAQAGSNRRPTRVFVDVATWVPKRVATSENVLAVATGPARCWTITMNERELPFQFNEPQVRRWLAERRLRLRQLGEDQKCERRLPKKARADIQGYRDAMCDRFDNRIDDWLHKMASMLAGLVKRYRAGDVLYDDSDTSWCPELPWFKLRSLVDQKLNEIGVTITHAGGSIETPAA